MKNKILNTLHGKITLSLALVIAFSMALFQTYIYYSLKDVLHNNLIETSEKRIQRLSNDLTIPMSKRDIDWVDSLISTEMQDETIHKIIVIADGKLFTSKGEAFEDDLKYHPEKFEHNHFSRSKEIIHDEQKIGELRFYIGMDSIEKRLEEEIQRAIFLTLLVTLIMTFVLGVILNRLILIPIHKLLNATHEISSGNYNSSALVLSDDEMGLLGQSINAMKSNIQTREIELNKSIDELNKFFTVTLDLLCIADLEGNFIRLNNSWKDVLGYPLDEIYKHKFFDFIHPEDMTSTFKAVEKLSSNQNVIGFINRY
jgi:methyl-accepting chemotaxis protein